MLGLGYEVEYFSTLNERVDSIVIVGENLTQSSYPDFLKPYLNAIKNLEEVTVECFKNFQKSYENASVFILLIEIMRINQFNHMKKAEFFA